MTTLVADATVRYPIQRVLPAIMSRAPLHTPEWFREEAEHCFQLAEKIVDQKASEALVAYGRELLGQAERMEAAVIAAAVEAPNKF